MIRLLVHQTRYELLTFARNRQARFFTLALPVIFLVIFVSVFGNNRIGPEHIKASTYYVPGIAALAVLTASFTNLVISITTQRQMGVLKRRRATPVPAWVLVAGRALTSLVVSLALSVAVGSLALACLGYAASTAIGSADGAQPTVLALTLPLSFISGVYIPSQRLPSALQHVAEAFPLQHLVAAMGRGFLPGAGGAVAWEDLAIVAAWGVVGLAFALRRFRWTPVTAIA
jgi:ABC-2 type transport system permease protein